MARAVKASGVDREAQLVVRLLSLFPLPPSPSSPGKKMVYVVVAEFTQVCELGDLDSDL